MGIADFDRESKPDHPGRDASSGRRRFRYLDGPTGNRGYADILPPLGDSTWSIGGDWGVGISTFFDRRCRIDRANGRKAE
jgi:hypothetical protein